LFFKNTAATSGLVQLRPTKLEVAANTAIKLGNAYFSSGGDYVHIANNEWYNGSAWTTNGSAGEMLQLTGSVTNFYSHDTAGSHTLQMTINGSGVGIGAAQSGRLLVGDGGDGFANMLKIRSNYPTIGFYDVDGRSAFWHNDSNHLYLLRGISTTGDPSTWVETYNGVWPLDIDLTNNNATFGAGVYATGFFYSSDRRLKENIQPLDQGLVTLMKLRPVSFTWKKGTPQAGRDDIGLIAQEVQKVLPDIVTANDKGILTIDYVRFTPVLIKAVQEQETQIEKQQQLIDQQRDQIQNLQQRMTQLEGGRAQTN
jgi:hypothetical protein